MTENRETPPPSLQDLYEIVLDVREAQEQQITNARVPGERITVGELVERVKDELGESTSLRAWGTYLDLLANGCAVLVSGKPFPGYGDRWVDEIVHRDLTHALRYVIARAKIRNDERAANRREAGRVVRLSDCDGAKRNATIAWRHAFASAVRNRHLHESLNPATDLKPPAKNTEARWAMDRLELAQVLQIAGGTGDDPDLDVLIVETILIAGARVEGILNLTVDGIDLVESAIYLIEKNNSKVWQPVPPSFCRKLLAFAQERGSHRPEDKVFVKRAIGKRPAAAIEQRRFDNIFCDRVQPALEWADKSQVTAHVARHSAVKLVERSFGSAVAQAFARHKPRNVTDIYAKASRSEVAAAVCRLWGNETHPWETRAPRLRR